MASKRSSRAARAAAILPPDIVFYEYALNQFVHGLQYGIIVRLIRYFFYNLYILNYAFTIQDKDGPCQ